MLFWGLSAASFVLAVIALIYDLEQIYFVAVTVCALPWLSRYLSQRGLASLRITLQSSGQIRMHVGERRGVRTVVYNTGRLPRVLCRATLRLPEGLRECETSWSQADTLGPDDSATLEVAMEGVRRGRYRVDRASLLTTDFVGVFEFGVDVQAVDVDVTVWPRVHRLPRTEDLVPRASPNHEHTNPAEKRGGGGDFYGVREYTPGDELRRVHWATTARHRSLTVVEFASPVGGAVSLVLDLERGLHVTGADGVSSLETAVEIVASLADTLIRSGRPVRLVAVGGRDWSMAPVEGVAKIEPILDALSLVSDSGTRAVDTVFRGVVAPMGPQDVVLVTARDARGLADTMARLRAGGHSATVVAIDAGSFRPEAGRPFVPPADARVLRKGDDLKTVLGGVA